MATKPDGIDLQNAEYDALKQLIKAYRGIEMVPVVDDEFPAIKHKYEGAVSTFLEACRANGRIR